MIHRNDGLPLWYRLSEESKANLAKLGRKLKGINWEVPELPDYRPRVEGNIEDAEECDRIMRVKPGFEKEEK